MGHPRRFFENNCVYFLTNRLAKGLPFVPCEYINEIILGIMAKASKQFPDISICHFLWMRNHYHMLIVSKGNPANIAGFMNIVNGESAKAVVRFLGYKNVKVWAQRYNCIRLLTPEVVVEKISYLYLNPVTANLVEDISKWPGVSSYGIKEEKLIKCRYLKPSKLIRLPNQKLNKTTHKELLKDIKKGEEHLLNVKPNEWINCFNDPDSIETYQNQINQKIEKEQKRLFNKRNFEVIGAITLQEQNPHQKHFPKSRGKRMFCMSTCLELRKQFIEYYNNFCEQCSIVWKAWKTGNFSIKYPPSAFIPSLWPLANTLKFET